jgi:hypothetical protein
MTFKIAITFLLWIAIITPLFLSMASADEDRAVSMVDDGEVLRHAGNLRNQKRKAQEDNGFTLLSFEEIEPMVPMEFFQSQNTWPVIVATVSDGTDQLVYYTAPMPSGVMPDKDYFLNFGKRYDNVDALSTALSTLVATSHDENIEPSISSTELQNLIKNWGYATTSKGNCYRYAANDMSGCPYVYSSWWNEHQESPGDINYVTQTIPANVCPTLLYYAKKDGMLPSQSNDNCLSSQRKVAVVAATSGTKVQDFHWYRQMYDGYWTHKPGFTTVTDKDASGKKITNPKTCTRGIYNLFCGYLCVQASGGTMINLDKNDVNKPPCQQ